MARKHITAAALAVTLVLGAAACGNDDDPSEPTGGPDPTPTEQPTTEPDDDGTDADGNGGVDGDDDPYAIPDDIDEAYAEAVINELLAVTSEALRMSVAANGSAAIPEEAQPLIGETHDGPRRLVAISDLQDAVFAENIEELYRQPDDMGNETIDVARVVLGTTECIVAVGEYDVSGTVVNPPEPTMSVFSLSRASNGAETTINPTPWLLFDAIELTADGVAPTRDQVEDLEYDDIVSLIDDSCGGVE